MRVTRPGEPPKARILLLSGLALILGAAFLWAGLNAPNSIPGRSYYNVTAELRDAGNLTAHTQVRMSGKLVGQVLDPRYESGRPVIDLQLETSIRPLQSDASLRVRPRSAVGSPYVELVRGTSERPLREGQRIRAGSTSAAEPIDEVLSAFDARTRVRTADLLQQLGRGVAGRGDDVNALLDAAPALQRDLRAALNPLRQDPEALRRLVPAAASVFGATAPLRNQIATGWRPGADVLDAINQREDLQETLDVAPAGLRALEGGLQRTDPLLAALNRFSAVSLPALRAAPGALIRTDALLRTATPTIGSLRGTLRRARDASEPALKLLESARPLHARLQSTFGALRPIVDELAPRRCDMLLLTDNWASMMSNGNADGNVLRLSIATFGFNSLTGIRPPGIRNPGQNKNPYPEPCQTDTDHFRVP